MIPVRFDHRTSPGYGLRTPGKTPDAGVGWGVRSIRTCRTRPACCKAIGHTRQRTSLHLLRRCAARHAIRVRARGDGWLVASPRSCCTARTTADGYLSPRHASPQQVDERMYDELAEAEELQDLPLLARGAASRAARKQLTPPVARSESSKLPCDEHVKHLEEKIARYANPLTPHAQDRLHALQESRWAV